jgi:hypothetical protein
VEWLTPEFIAGVGFPVTCCIYLLVRLEGTLKQLASSVNNNNILVRALLVKMGVELDAVKEAG